MSEQKLHDEDRRGMYAQELLDNPVFKDLWTDFEKQVIGELKRSSPRDADGREKCVLMLQMLDKLKAMIEQSAATGKMARMEIARKRTMMEQARQWIGRDGLIA